MNKSLPSLKQQAITGTKWVGFSNIIVTVLLVTRITVMGRLLEPTDFGLMGMIMVVINFALLFADFGISKAIIQKQNVSNKQLSSLYWSNIIVGILVMLIIIAAAPLVAAFYHEKRLVTLIIYSSIIFPITAIGQQFQMLLEKEMIFDKLTIAEVAGSLVGTFSAIVCAFYGYGVLSLIVGQIIIAVIKTVFLLIIGLKIHRPKFFFDFNSIREFLGFGLFQMGERFLNFFAGNVDYILIGRFLGSGILGTYYFAYELVLMPVTRINPILTKVAFPAFSKKQLDNQALNNGYIALIRLIAYIGIPLLVGLAVTAPVGVPLIFGGKWKEAIILVQILALLGIFRTLVNPVGTIQYAKGRADVGFYWNLGAFVTYALFLYLVVRQGVIAVSVTNVILTIINFIANVFIIRYLTGLEVSRYFPALFKPLQFSLIMGVTVYGLYMILKYLTIQAYILMPIMVIFGIGIYILLAFIFDRQYCMELISNVFNRRAKGL